MSDVFPNCTEFFSSYFLFKPTVHQYDYAAELPFLMRYALELLCVWGWNGSTFWKHALQFTTYSKKPKPKKSFSSCRFVGCYFPFFSYWDIFFPCYSDSVLVHPNCRSVGIFAALLLWVKVVFFHVQTIRFRSTCFSKTKTSFN